jgi:hypothetical protein
MYFGFVSYFDSRSRVNQRVEIVSHSRAYHYGSLLAWVFHWGNNERVGTFAPDGSKELIKSDFQMGLKDSLFNIDDNFGDNDTWDQVARHFVSKATLTFSDLI